MLSTGRRMLQAEECSSFLYFFSRKIRRRPRLQSVSCPLEGFSVPIAGQRWSRSGFVGCGAVLGTPMMSLFGSGFLHNSFNIKSATSASSKYWMWE